MTPGGAFNIDSLLDEQIYQLGQRNIQLTKRATIDRDTTEAVLVPSPAEWKSELETFRQLGMINKDLYRDQYHREGPLRDFRSNLQILRYVASSAPLTSFSIYYRDNLNKMKRLEGIVTETNQLYSAHRTLVMEFDEIHDQLLLSSFQIKGYQKVALRDTVHLAIVGTIHW
ncbi:MAG: hypothetical protein JNL40_14935 [Cyclobacteriaceae bacterium]|nr:hypothetical protein [Cyclobacteriaceae bacterium]